MLLFKVLCKGSLEWGFGTNFCWDWTHLYSDAFYSPFLNFDNPHGKKQQNRTQQNQQTKKISKG